MNPLKHWPTPAETRRVSLAGIARELGCTQHRTRKLLHKAGYWTSAGPRGLGRPNYNADVIEVLRALLNQGYNNLQPRQTDWLTGYLNRSEPPK